MQIYFTYSLPSGEWQTLAAVDSIEEALHICDGQHCKLFISFSDLPELIKGIRNYRGITQTKFAEMLGGKYSKGHISYIENGKTPIGFKLLQDIGKAFNIEFGISATILEKKI